MANVDSPMGFKPRRKVGGGAPGQANAYPLASAYSSNIFTGDAVVLSSGKVQVATASSDGLQGVFAGCQYTASDGSIVFSPYWPASTVTSGSVDAVAFVYDDPDTIFEAQVSDDVAFVLATHNYSLCDLVSTHTGSTVTGQSKQELLVGTAGDEQFQVLQLIDRIGNAVGNWAKVECKIHNHALIGAYSVTTG